MAEKGVLTVEVKATELDVVKKMTEELAFLRYFYAKSSIAFSDIDDDIYSLIKECYEEDSGCPVPEGYQ